VNFNYGKDVRYFSANVMENLWQLKWSRFPVGRAAIKFA
jgi:hypothetical protein